MQSTIDSLRKELSDARALASTLQAETDAWKTRYEELKPQLAGSAARETALLDSLRQDLVQIAIQATEGRSVSQVILFLAHVSGRWANQLAQQFCNYMKSLPETYRTSSDDQCLVVFRGNKFPHLLSKVRTLVLVCESVLTRDLRFPSLGSEKSKVRYTPLSTASSCVVIEFVVMANSAVSTPPCNSGAHHPSMHMSCHHSTISTPSRRQGRRPGL